MFLKKLRETRIWKRIFLERLTEPLHLNVLAALIWPFGTFRMKVAWDLVLRHQHAFGLLTAADSAAALGLKSLTVVELGVGTGAGLRNLCALAPRVTRLTGINFQIIGVDSGGGLPEPRDYRDHPEYYATGEYAMDVAAVRQRLPANASLILGDMQEVVPDVVARLSTESPLGFVSIDVDYYWSARDALPLFEAEASRYLPIMPLYVDDIGFAGHNPWCGEWLALEEFNAGHERRKIARFNMLREERIFKHARWISRMYTLHVFDHPARTPRAQQKRFESSPPDPLSTSWRGETNL